MSFLIAIEPIAHNRGQVQANHDNESQGQGVLAGQAEPSLPPDDDPAERHPPLTLIRQEEPLQGQHEETEIPVY